jgi:hypothetical protein
MSIAPVSGTPGVVPVSKPPPKPAAEEAAPVPADKVTISPGAAKIAAGGDADHDGDAR